MATIRPLKIEIETALAYLRKPSHKGRFERAANRLEKLSQDILNPQPKAKKSKVWDARLRSGSGRYYPIKIALDDNAKAGIDRFLQ